LFAADGVTGAGKHFSAGLSTFAARETCRSPASTAAPGDKKGGKKSGVSGRREPVARARGL